MTCSVHRSGHVNKCWQQRVKVGQETEAHTRGSDTRASPGATSTKGGRSLSGTGSGTTSFTQSTIRDTSGVSLSSPLTEESQYCPFPLPLPLRKLGSRGVRLQMCALDARPNMWHWWAMLVFLGHEAPFPPTQAPGKSLQSALPRRLCVY